MAEICILTITQSVGANSGVWQHLTEKFLPSWINEGFGMEWATKPYVDNVTKMHACAVTNKHGNKSRIFLRSLRNEKEVEERYKGPEYSMVWLTEGSKFKERKTFDTLKQCFRGIPGLGVNDYLFLCDSNPCLDTGKNHWLYKLWYEFRTANPELLQKLYPHADPKDLVPLQRALKLIEFTVDDNLWLTPEKKAQLRADFVHNQDLLDAYYYGKWVTASDDALFFKVFRPNYHVIGEIETASEPSPEILLPEDNCSTLILSMDPGGVNCGSVIMEKVIDLREKFLNDEKVLVEVPVIKMLDELVVVGQDFDLWDYVEQLCEKMDYWENQIGRPVMWNMWSDRSVFDMRVPFSDRFWSSYIFEASAGRIQLIGVERGRGSVAQRVELFRKVVFEDRFFMTKSKCPNAIEMCLSIRRGKGTKAIAVGDPLKHIFDAITYGLGQELYDELRMSNIMNIRNESSGKTSLVSVAL